MKHRSITGVVKHRSITGVVKHRSISTEVVKHRLITGVSKIIYKVDCCEIWPSLSKSYKSSRFKRDVKHRSITRVVKIIFTRLIVVRCDFYLAKSF